MLDDNTPVRVLLVDDDPAILKAYGSVLTRHGAARRVCDERQGGRRARRRRRLRRDRERHRMPEMTGIEFLKAVRAHDLDVPVILMTGGPRWIASTWPSGPSTTARFAT